MNRMDALIRIRWECASFLLPCEDAGRSCQSKKLKPERGLSPEPCPASTLILDFPSSKSVRNKFLLFFELLGGCIFVL